MPRLLCLLAAAALAAVLAGASPAAQAPAGDEEVQVAVPAPVMKVVVSGGLLNVELAGAAFGDVMKAVASRSGIQTQVTGDVANRPVTTKFRGLELEDGIMRLLSLVQERNFFFSYDEKGGLKRIEIYGAAAPAASQKKDRPAGQKAAQPGKLIPSSPVPSAPSGSPSVRKNPPASQRIIRPSRGRAAESQPNETETDLPENQGGNAAEEAPAALPSGKAPVYLPPPPLNP